MLIVAIVLATILIATGVFVWRLRTREAWRPLLPGLAVTVVGLVATAVVYLWVFETGPSCSGPADFACQMNANQGVLTLLGLVLAAAALWTTVATRYLDRRRETKAHESSVLTALLAALEEVEHNLVHVALAYGDDDNLGGVPLLSTTATASLLEQPVRSGLHGSVLTPAERMLRNYESLKKLVEGEAKSDATTPDAQEPWSLQAYVNQSLHLLIGAAVTSVGMRTFFTKPGLHDICTIAAAQSYYLCFRTSDDEFKSELATLRSRRVLVTCWWNDEPPERLTVLPQGPVFRDLARSHGPH